MRAASIRGCGGRPLFHIHLDEGIIDNDLTDIQHGGDRFALP